MTAKIVTSDEATPLETIYRNGATIRVETRPASADHPEPSISVYTETADRGQSISYPLARTDVFVLNDQGRTVDVYRNRSDG